MYIYRAINELDRKMKPLENGIIARSVYDEILKPRYEFVAGVTFNKEQYKFEDEIEASCHDPKFDIKLTEKDIEKLYRGFRANMLIEMYPAQIIKLADKNQREINEAINHIKATNGQSKESLEKIISYLTSKNGHIAHGNDNDYPWISFSTDYNLVKSFYDCQIVHEIAVVESNINKIIDTCNGDYLFAYDLSSNDVIENNEFLINKDTTHTALNYRGLNYAKKSKEIIYYNRVPKEKIVTVLNTIEYELLLLGILDEKYFNLPFLTKNYILMQAYSNIKRIIKNHEYLFDLVYVEHFIKSLSLEKIAKDNSINLETLKEIKQIIISEISKDQDIKRKVKIYQ